MEYYTAVKKDETMVSGIQWKRYQICYCAKLEILYKTETKKYIFFKCLTFRIFWENFGIEYSSRYKKWLPL